MKSIVAICCILTCVSSVITLDEYDTLTSVLDSRGLEDDDYKLQMPLHGILQKFSGLLKNIFTLHRGKIDDLSGKLDDAFHRVLTIEGKTKEYESKYPASSSSSSSSSSYETYPVSSVSGSSSYASCCPTEDQVYDYLKTNQINLGSRLQLNELIPLWGKIARLDAILYQNHNTLRTYLSTIKRLDELSRNRKGYRELDTSEIEKYLNSFPSH